MKNWTLFNWAITRVKFDESGNVTKSIGNDILLRLMDLSGVKPADVYERMS